MALDEIYKSLSIMFFFFLTSFAPSLTFLKEVKFGYIFNCFLNDGQMSTAPFNVCFNAQTGQHCFIIAK